MNRPDEPPQEARGGVVLIAHGSPDPRHSQGVRAIAHRLAVSTSHTVDCCYLEHDSPSASTLLARHNERPPATRPPTTTWYLPLLLSAGYHWHNDIPTVVAARGDHAHLLGPVPADLLCEAVREAVSQHTVKDLVICGSGSRSAAARATIAEICQRLRYSQPLPGVESVAGCTGPAELAAVCGPDTLVVPLLVSAGVLSDRIDREAEAARAATTPVVGQTAAFARGLARMVSVAGSPRPGSSPQHAGSSTTA